MESRRKGLLVKSQKKNMGRPLLSSHCVLLQCVFNVLLGRCEMCSRTSVTAVVTGPKHRGGVVQVQMKGPTSKVGASTGGRAGGVVGMLGPGLPVDVPAALWAPR